MPDNGRRIIDQDSALTINPEDNLIIDSVANGTRKATYTVLSNAINETLGIDAVKTKANGAMQKSVYDADGDGVVDNAEALQGHASDYFATASDLTALSGTVTTGLAAKMSIATYDTNNNGIVDNAEKVNNHNVYMDVPADAVFTDTVYDDTAITTRMTAAETTLSTKANQTDLTALTTRVTATETDIGALEATVDLLPEPASTDGVFVVTQNNGNMTLTDLGDAVSDKADTDGTYPNMTVGLAEDLVAGEAFVDKTPYLYRPSCGSLHEDVEYEYPTIVGGTLAWNQLLQNGDFANEDNWRYSNVASHSVSNNVQSFTASALQGGVRQDKVFENHKYFVAVSVKLTTATNLVRIYVRTTTPKAYYTINTTDWQVLSGVFDGGESYNGYVRVDDLRESGWDEVKIKNFTLFDLTLAFGSAIADYIYSLEQANAGAGVAYFRKLFPNDYYEYNAGSLESVQVSEHRTVGFNQFAGNSTDNHQYEGHYVIGDSSSNYAKIANNNYNCFKIRVLPNTTYCISTQGAYDMGMIANKRFLDSSGNFISGNVAGWNKKIATFTTPSNCVYIEFAMETTSPAKICINLSWSGTRNGEYEPYVSYNYPLDPIVLRGIPKKADDGSIYYDGDTYEADGTVTRKYGIVDLGTLNWYAQEGGTHGYFQTSDLAVKPPINSSVAISNIILSNGKYSLASASIVVAGETDKVIGVRSNTRLAIADFSYTDAASFKQMLINENVKLVYELATPTTETAAPYTVPQIVDPYGTEEWIDERAVPIPVGQATPYHTNMKKKIEDLPTATDILTLENSIAPVENGTTASRTYSAGQYFMKNHQFCKAKVAIASGATFTLNTNYEPTTVAAELYAALNS